MKFETLLLRYKKLGYEVLGLSQELELDSIISWVFANHNYLITVRPIIGLERRMVNLTLKNEGKKELKPELLFSYNCYKDVGSDLETDYNGVGTKALSTPYEAKFLALKTIYKGIKFWDGI